MAAGEAVIWFGQITAAAPTQNIQPALGEEWEIHVIWHGADMSIKFGDGTNWVTITAVGEGVEEQLKYLINNTYFLQIENTSGADAYYGYMGIQTK